MAGTANALTRIEGYELRCPMPAPAGNALRVFDHRSAFLVKVTTAAGAVGWGETWAYPGPANSFIRRVLAPAMIGADVTNPRAAQARMLAFAVPDRRGQVHMALSAIDIAIWDAWGRTVGQPIHALLGGKLRDRVTAYASGPLLPAGADRYAGFAEAVEGYVKAGFRAVKIRIGTTLAEDLRSIRQARAIVGDDALLMVDMNEGSSVRDALALAQQAADVRLAWIEEPVPHDNLPAYKSLAARLPLPLAGGESFCGLQAFRDSLCEGALDIVQPDLSICGGLTEGLRIAALADAFETPVMPHVWGTGINFLASLQFAAVLTPRRGYLPFPLFEYDMGFNPLRAEICDPKPDAEGAIAIPDGPGLGMDIEIDRLAGYVVDRWAVER